MTGDQGTPMILRDTWLRDGGTGASCKPSKPGLTRRNRKVCVPRPEKMQLAKIAETQRWAIDCFKCVSIDGDNKPCDDPFHNNGSRAFLESPCLGGRKGRDGLFPATACLKIAGVYDESGVTLMVRGCALDSGTLTTDSEIIRMSHCGGFYFDDKYVRGCVQSCSDADACNASSRNLAPLIALVLPILAGLA
ncbi:PREDICTED: uncharacterized protein LOC108775913 [Cyphomyrmex costatus]|uniref:uncharacterized protein LOC108775913 n=1 Tax=Cyphomyrmex costatus TaxID=456900 RepID=UPI0008523DE2|nr:PREDICTED: uncharacterized protein LOC108775913 [Cyphomyrmex costatus]